MTTPTRAGRRWRATAATLVAAGVAFTGLGPGTASASSHREAPLIAADPAVDNTDVYAFVSPERPGYVTFVANWHPVRGAQRRARTSTRSPPTPAYNINVDNDGDAKAGRHLPLDVPEHRQARQRHVPVQQRPGHLARRREPAVPPDLHAGVLVQRRAVQDPHHRRPGRAVAGRPGLDAGLRRRCATRPTIDLPGRLEGLRRPGRRPVLPRPAGVRPALRRRPERGRPGHAGRLQREHHRAAGAVQGRGAQAATPSATRSSASGPRPSAPRVRMTGGRRSSGDRVQVSRLGNPLVNEVVVPAGLKDAFNSLSPGQGRHHPGRRRPGHRPRGAEADRGASTSCRRRPRRATTWSRSS